jgi:hypothetical protein
VEPAFDTPTEPRDYAALSITFAALLGGTALSARRRPPIPAHEILPLSAATFALSKLIVHEKVESWMRRPFVDEQPEGRRPRGRRLRYAVGELLTCTRCTGAWGALALTALRVHAPRTGQTVTTVLAASAGNDFLQAGFSALCARSRPKESTSETVQPVRVTPRRAA